LIKEENKCLESKYMKIEKILRQLTLDKKGSCPHFHCPHFHRGRMYLFPLDKDLTVVYTLGINI